MSYPFIAFSLYQYMKGRHYQQLVEIKMKQNRTVNAMETELGQFMTLSIQSIIYKWKSFPFPWFHFRSVFIPFFCASYLLCVRSTFWAFMCVILLHHAEINTEKPIKVLSLIQRYLNRNSFICFLFLDSCCFNI